MKPNFYLYGREIDFINQLIDNLGKFNNNKSNLKRMNKDSLVFSIREGTSASKSWQSQSNQNDQNISFGKDTFDRCSRFLYDLLGFIEEDKFS